MLGVNHKIVNIEISNVQSSPKNLWPVISSSEKHTLEIFFFLNYDLNSNRILILSHQLKELGELKAENERQSEVRVDCTM